MTILATAETDEGDHDDDPEHKGKLSQEGPINHSSIFKLAVVEVIANFSVSVGFYIVGSGVSIAAPKRCVLSFVLLQLTNSTPIQPASPLSSPRCTK